MVTQSARDRGKSATAFRTIGEVSLELDLPQHVLRFWETKFTRLRPMKRGGGRRYYRPEDIELLQRIRRLLYEDGYTIKGVQKLLREGAGKTEIAAGPAGPVAAAVAEPKAAPVAPERPPEKPQNQPPVATPAAVQHAGLDQDSRQAISAIIVELEELRALLKKQE